MPRPCCPRTTGKAPHSHLAIEALRKLTFASREVVECEVCGIANTIVLEAAHIHPDAEGGPSSSDNAAILCRNHHRAFDADLLVRHDDGRYTWAPDVTPF